MLSWKHRFTQATPALLLSALLASGTSFATAQEPNPTSGVSPDQAAQQPTERDGIYLYRVKVVQRDLDAVNYLHRSGSTRVGFQGTALLPQASGEAKVTSERGGITIDAGFKGLTPANGFGPEYLTYVLWAITPDGRPSNLGEILPAGDKNNITVTTSLQSFGLIVTAEPYFSVSSPPTSSSSRTSSSKTIPRACSKRSTPTTPSFRAAPTPRPTVRRPSPTPSPATRSPRSSSTRHYNAVRIAQNTGADKYAADIMTPGQAGPPQRLRHRQQ